MFVKVPLLPARRPRLKGLVSARPEQRRRRSRAFDRARVFGYFICSRFGGLSLSLSLSVFSSFDSFFDVMNAFFDTTRREEECLLPKCSRKVAGGGRVELPRARDASLRLSVSVCILFCGVFASFPNENKKYVFLSVSIRSPRWGDLYVEANPSFAWILRLARGKETRHRRASPREASERPKVVQTSSEKVFRGKE